jgi:hypothetical protein
MNVRRLIATLAPKGGVGKTYVAKLLFDLLPTRSRVVSAWDLDAATGTFSVYSDAIKTFDLNGKRSSYSWLDDCHREDIDDVLIDVPGGRIDDLLATFGDNGIDALVQSIRASGREFVVITPIGVMIAETVTAQVVLNAFRGTAARLVIAKNGRFGNTEDFIIYDGLETDGLRRYGATSDLARAAGAESIFIPTLAPRLVAQIDAEQMRLQEAAGPVGAERLGRLSSARVQMYLATVGEALSGTSIDLTGVIPLQASQ